MIGQNVRRARESVGLTVTDAAKRAALSKANLSKIETGQISTPIATLIRIADALGVELASFFVNPKRQPSYVLTRKDQGQVIARDGSAFGYSYEALAIGIAGKHAEPFVLTIKPGDPVGDFQHGGEEFIYMLSGRLGFTIGDATMKLGPGDSLYFDPEIVHKTQVIGKRPARFLCVFIQKDGAGVPHGGRAVQAKQARQSKEKRK